jgi:hypothetical protein
MATPKSQTPLDPEDIYADEIGEDVELPDWEGAEYDYELESFYREETELTQDD